MRACAKTQCNDPATATIALRYDRREVALFDLMAEHDPNYLDLCRHHADRLVPPLGWAVRDTRTSGHGEALATATVGGPRAGEQELRLGAFEPTPPRWPLSPETDRPRNGDGHTGTPAAGPDELGEHQAGAEPGEDPGPAQPPLGGLG